MNLHLQTNNLCQSTTCIVRAMLSARTISTTQMFTLFCPYISLFTKHDSSSFHHRALFFSASVGWWFLLSPPHNLLMVVPKALLAWAEICGPLDGGVYEVILTDTYHSRSRFMTEVRKTDLRLTEIKFNLRDGWVQEKRRQKCRGTWAGQYII